MQSQKYEVSDSVVVCPSKWLASPSCSSQVKAIASTIFLDNAVCQIVIHTGFFTKTVKFTATFGPDLSFYARKFKWVAEVRRYSQCTVHNNWQTPFLPSTHKSTNVTLFAGSLDAIKQWQKTDLDTKYGNWFFFALRLHFSELPLQTTVKREIFPWVELSLPVQMESSLCSSPLEVVCRLPVVFVY